MSRSVEQRPIAKPPRLRIHGVSPDPPDRTDHFGLARPAAASSARSGVGASITTGAPGNDLLKSLSSCRHCAFSEKSCVVSVVIAKCVIA